MDRYGQVTCAIEGCESPIDGRQWCHAHYQRWRKYRDPMGFGGRSEKEYLPYGPLRDYISRCGGRASALKSQGKKGTRRFERAEKILNRASKDGVMSIKVADKFAVKVLGVHPSFVWGDMWWLPAERWHPDDERQAS